MVSGYSGVGKSALVNALQKPIVEKRGYFIAGKFDQYKRDIPYATLPKPSRAWSARSWVRATPESESGGTPCARRSARAASSWSISSPSSSS